MPAGQIEISLRLIDAETQSTFWAGSYERPFTEHQVLEREISLAVADELGLRLTCREREDLSRHDTDDSAAKRSYMEGQYDWNRRTPVALKEALKHFHEATVQDPNYAKAHLGVAQCYSVFGIYDLGKETDTAPRAMRAIDRALLGTDGHAVAAAYAVRGLVKATYEWDWNAAEQDLKKAIELDPDDATARHWYALLLAWTNRPGEALRTQREAVNLDPQSAVLNMTVGVILHYQREFDRAIEQYEKTMSLAPDFATVHYYLGKSYQEKRLYERAEESYREDLKRSGERPLVLATLLTFA